MIPPYSQDCVDLVKASEGLRLDCYADPVGIRTWGYGHVVLNGEDFDTDCTEARACAVLRKDLDIAWNGVAQYVEVGLTQGQVDALTDFVLNLGVGNFARSTLLKLINQGEYLRAADEFHKWRYSQQIELPGLVIRRAAERDLFLSA